MLELVISNFHDKITKAEMKVKCCRDESSNDEKIFLYCQLEKDTGATKMTLKFIQKRI